MRDGQQSLFATRMSQEQVERVLPYYKDAGFYAIEVWGGAVPDSIMRFLGEDPWYRLESIKSAIGDISKLTALSRGRNLFGYNPYPEDVIEGFNRNAVKSGIGIMRIFDCLKPLSKIASGTPCESIRSGRLRTSPSRPEQPSVMSTSGCASTERRGSSGGPA